MFAASVGRLYAINTAGAVIGVAAAGFALIPVLGLWRTAVIAAVLDLAIAVAVMVGRPAPPPAGEWTRPIPAPGSGVDRERPVPPPDGSRSGAGASMQDGAQASTLVAAARARASGFDRLIVPLFAVSGFAAILYEIAWTRILSVPLGGMVYSFSAILMLYLLGIALGSAAAAAILRSSRAPVALFGVCQVLLAGVVVLGGHLVGQVPFWMAALVARSIDAPATLVSGELRILALIILPPTLLLGALFPLAAAIRRRAQMETGAGAAVGAVYAANTFGSIAGSILTGFLLIPAVGALRAILFAALANLLIGIAALLSSEWSARARRGTVLAAGIAAAAVGAFALPEWPAQRMSLGFTRLLRAYRFGGADRGAGMVTRLVATSGLPEGSEKLLWYREGRLASVAVIESPGRRGLVVNGKPDATIGAGEDMMTQVMIGQLPLLLVPRGADVCIVGYGSGVTTHSVLTHPVREATTVEIEEAVIQAAPYFKEGAFDPLDDPRSRLVIEDAGTFLRSTDRKYDVVISEPSNPWIAGVGDLFTREFYDAAAIRLKPGGLFCQWLQCYEIAPQTQRTIFRTLARRFPHGQVFYFRPSNDLVILASPDREVLFDPTVMKAGFDQPAVAADLARVGVPSAADLMRYYRGRLERLAAKSGEGPINTDDNGWLEHHAPLDLLIAPDRGEDYGLPEDVAGDLAVSLGPNPDRAARFLLEAADRAVAVADRASLRTFALALERLGRPESAEVTKSLEDLDRRAAAAKQAAVILANAMPILTEATRSGDQQQGEKVAALLDQAAALDPANGEIAWRHGTALIAAHRPDEAIRELRRALGMLPAERQFPVHRDLVTANFFKLDLGAAEAELAEMEHLRPGSPEGRYWRARIYHQRGDDARARAEIESGLQDDPENPRLLQLQRQLGR